MIRVSVEKFIEKKLESIKGVEKFFVEKGDSETLDVVVVSSMTDTKSTSRILDLERKVNKEYHIPSQFKIYPIEAW
jgi:hypothetical protein